MEKNETSTIRLRIETKEKIKDLAIIPNETYDHIINRVLFDKDSDIEV